MLWDFSSGMRYVDVQPAPRMRMSTMELEQVGRGWVVIMSVIVEMGA